MTYRAIISGKIDLCTIGNFLRQVPVKVLEHPYYSYTQLIDLAHDDGAIYRTRVAHLLRKKWREPGLFLAKQCTEFVPQKGQFGLYEALEAMSVRSLEQFGAPTHAFLSDNKIYALNPKDFLLFLYFDDQGRPYSALACLAPKKAYYMDVKYLDKSAIDHYENTTLPG